MGLGLRSVQDPKIRRLAETLRQNGLAASDSEAIRMASNMVETERKVTQHFDNNKASAVMNTGGKLVEVQETISASQSSASSPGVSSSNTSGNVVFGNASNSVSSVNYASAERISREGEVTVQEEPRMDSPAPTHSNAAIAEAIRTVQNKFSSSNSEPSSSSSSSSSPAVFVDSSLDSEKPIKELLQDSVDSDNGPASTPDNTPIRNNVEAAGSVKPQQRIVVDRTINDAPQSSDSVERIGFNETKTIENEKILSAMNSSQDSVDEQPETTVEVRDEPAGNDDLRQKAAEMEESKVDLGEIFDFSNK